MEGEFCGRTSDSGESDDSSVPSRYSSEGDVPLPTYDVSSESDDPTVGEQTYGDSLQSSTVSISEERKIVGILSAESEQSYFGIFPTITEAALTKHHPHIVQRLRELPDRNRTVIISGGSLLKMIDPSWEGRVPASVLYDACVFSPTQPVMVLTFTVGDGDSHKNIQYNTQLAALIIQHVKVDWKFDFNIIHDTVDTSLCKNKQDFLMKIEQSEKSAKCICFPAELHMDEAKCTAIIETFLKYLSRGNESARRSPSIEDTARVKVPFKQDVETRLDELRHQLRTMDEEHHQVISEVNRHHEEKLTKLAYLHALRKKALEKEIEELIQKPRRQKRDETWDLQQMNLSPGTSSKMNTFPKCSVCQQQFTLKGPVPYLLPCLHAVCETCVTSAAGGVISCATCQREVNLTDTSLQKDAVRQKEIFHLTVKHRPTELLCTNEDGSQAVCWCQECEEVLCEYCQNTHNDLKPTRNHILQNFSDMEPTALNIPTFCSSHKHNSLDLFDKSCQKLICAKCKLHDHADHEVEELDVVADAVTKQFRHYKDELVKLKKTATQNTTWDTLQETIACTFKPLHSLLDRRESELMTSLEKELKATEHALLTITEDDWMKCADVSDYIDKILLYSPKLHILELETRVGDIARGCLKHAVPQACFNTDKLSGLKSAISVLGAITTDLAGECVHKLKPGTVDRSFMLKCTPVKYDKDRVNTDYVHINTEGDLVNRKSDTRPAGKGRLKKYLGTCSTVPLSQDGCPQYWEVENRVSLDKPLIETNLILEVGVCREEQRDVHHYIGGRPHSYRMAVAHCTTHGGICRDIWKEGKCVLCLPDTLPNTAGESHTLHYGVVYDDARKKIVFIDVKEKKVMSTLDNVDSSEPLWPMFGVYNPDNLTVSMRLVVGSDINMTEEKKAMIVKALS